MLSSALKTKTIGPDPYDVQLGQNLRHARNCREISLTTLAEAIGKTYQQVQKYETAQNRVAVSTLIRISLFLRVDIYTLLAGIDGIGPSDKPEGTQDMADCLKRVEETLPLTGERFSALVQALDDLDVAVDNRNQGK